MSYFKNRIKKEVNADFEFTQNGYPISDHVKNKYIVLKNCFHRAIHNLKNYKPGDETHQAAYKGAKEIIEFYDAGNFYMTVLIEEIFKEPLDKKGELFAILNKLFKMFFVYDVLSHKHRNIFHDFSIWKGEMQDIRFVDKFTMFSAISMPMGHLFISYFCTEYAEIYAPRELCRRTNIYLDEGKMHHLYKLACIGCKFKDLVYIRIFICGVYNRYFQSSYFIEFIDKLDEQKQIYYVALAEYAIDKG